MNTFRTDRILEFIQRRFSKDYDWTNGNCYYFAVILDNRFPGGDICYDVTDGHFLYRNYSGAYYDWTGLVHPTGTVIKWKEFREYDYKQYQRIIENCVV